ncbi:MAG: citrate synthase, partial [Clostridia bacterium]|nr:citrate synthase [Clostridia bacterium]
MNGFLKKEYKKLLKDGYIAPELYDVYKVKKGLRNDNGTGVLVGLTKVSDVSGYNEVDGKKLSKEGNLYYRNIDITDVAKLAGGGFGYENTCFLLLFGHYPDEKEAAEFLSLIRDNYNLPNGFLEKVILPNPSGSIMNDISRSVLSLYSFDPDPDDVSGEGLVSKGVDLIAKMPAIISYCLQSKTHYLDGDSLHIHFPKKEYSFAENVLYLSRNDGKFTDLEAKILDTCLMVHADHGGGNNSAFVGSVVASTLTDIYSMVSASLASLKGPRHGGASAAAKKMMNAVIEEIGTDASDEQIENVVARILNKDFYDKSGRIYGLGHAVYTLSDPRCILLRDTAEELAKTHSYDKFLFYKRFEKIAKAKLKEKTG